LVVLQKVHQVHVELMHSKHLAYSLIGKNGITVLELPLVDTWESEQGNTSKNGMNKVMRA
jgi:hypothetical protein